jgi:hypothetical protein
MSTLNQTWWDKALIATQNLRQPYVFPGVFPEQVDELSKLAREVLRNLMLAKGTSGGFRIWVSDEHGVVPVEPSTEYSQIICTNPLEEDESLADWAKRVFGSKRFGIILNDGEMYSAEMNRRLAMMIRPLLDTIGMPLTGVTTAYFVGNYGYTPIGIHQDKVGEDVFHFHLGPGPKTMYTWDQDLYKEISGVPNNHDVEPLLHRADKYDFGTGDIYFMPWDKFHVGYSGDLSLGVSVWLNSPTPAAFIRRVARAILGEITPVRDPLVMKKTVLSPDKGVPGDMKIFEEIAPFVKLDESMADLSLQEFMHVSVENYRLGLLSNSGFTLLQQPTNHPWELLRGQTVRLVQPFRMYHTRFKNKLYMFIRGYKIELNYHPALPEMLNALNLGTDYRVDDLIQPLLEDWPEAVAFQVLNILFNHRGIETLEPIAKAQPVPAPLALSAV